MLSAIWNQCSKLPNKNFYFKGTQKFTGCYPNNDWLCHPWLPLNIIFSYKGWPRVTNQTMIRKTPCKSYCALSL